MGEQIVKTPDNKWFVWTDGKLIFGPTSKDSILEFYIGRARDKAVKNTNMIFEAIEDGQTTFFEGQVRYDQVEKSLKAQLGQLDDQNTGQQVSERRDSSSRDAVEDVSEDTDSGD